jgi:hypothetical protein
MPNWPLQKDCDTFYGNPRGAAGKPSAAWESANLVLVKCPWVLRYDGTPVKGLRVHKKCAESLKRVLAAIWDRLGHSQAEIDRIGMSIYGGGYNFRKMRGGSALSMHSWGCALDFDPARNGMGDTTPNMDLRVVEEFEREGWEWGGHWKDGMHFQAAWTRPNPPRLKRKLSIVKADVQGIADIEPAETAVVPVDAEPAEQEQQIHDSAERDAEPRMSWMRRKWRALTATVTGGGSVGLLGYLTDPWAMAVLFGFVVATCLIIFVIVLILMGPREVRAWVRKQVT